MKSIFISFLYFSLSINIFAQYKFPIPENVNLAKELLVKNKEAELVSLNNTIEYNFGLYKNKNFDYQVPNCEIKNSNEQISLKDNVQQLVADYYDTESQIFNLRANWVYKSNRGPINAYFEDAPYQSEGIFHTDIRYKAYVLNYYRLGDRASYQYTKKQNEIRYINQISFIDANPTAKKVIKVNIPKWLEIDLIELNFEGYDIKKEVIDNPTIGGKTHIFTALNLPAKSKDKNQPEELIEQPYVLFHLKSYTANGTKISIFNTEQDLYKWLKIINDKVDNKQELLKKLVQEITKDKATDIEVIKSLYYWVQDNIRYIAFENGIAGYQSASAWDVCSKKYGDCKGMANLLVNMLKLKGYEANLTWIGTRDSRNLDYKYPSLLTDNHAICTLFLKDKTYYLDATESFIALGYNGFRIQGRPALVSKVESGQVVKVPDGNVEDNIEKTYRKIVLKDQVLIGSFTKTLKNESKNELSRTLKSYGKSNYNELITNYLHSDLQNEKITNVSIVNLENRDTETKISFDFEVKNKIISIDNQLYVDIFIEKLFAKVVDDKRTTGVAFQRKYCIDNTTEIAIPTGYSVSELPESLIETNEDYTVDLKFFKKNNILFYTQKITLLNGIIKKNNIASWISLQSKINKFYESQIVISKI